MSLKLNATLTVAGVTLHAESDSVAGLIDAINGLTAGLDPKTGTGQASAPTPAPTPETAKGKKSASTDKPASSPPPADSTKADSAASAPTPASSSPAPAAVEVTYEKSGLGEKIAAYLGIKDSAGYADRRSKLVELLKKFDATSGKNLKPAQFAEFDADLAKLVGAAAEEDLS
jgi:hypothetical protein